MPFSIRAFYQPTVLLAVALMAIIVMMVLPVPSWVLDVGLAASFALAILIFTVTLFIERPLDFSAFPTILLASLMLRLSLNVSSTKLIIGEGHTGTDAAGDVIEGFAMFVMGGSVFLGLVVFCVLLIVNFMVINKGATRMAEVGARFALDGMPGKQMAIDADMSAGAITHQEAKERRAREQQETTFFGSLDGASKFVKGDAIAGLLITLLNLVAGLIMGTLVHGMPIGDAFRDLCDPDSRRRSGVADTRGDHLDRFRALAGTWRGAGFYRPRDVRAAEQAPCSARYSRLPHDALCAGAGDAVCAVHGRRSGLGLSLIPGVPQGGG